MKSISLYCSTVFNSKISKDVAIGKAYEIVNRLNQEIGNPVDMTSSYKREIESSLVEIKLLKNSKQDKQSKERIKLKLKDIKMYKKRILSEKKRFKMHKELYTDLGKHVANVLSSTNFLMNYSDIIDSFNLMAKKYLGYPLMDLNGKNVPTVQSYLLMTKRFIKVKPKKQMGKWNEYHRDTFRMVATQEETGVGIALLNKIEGLKDVIYEQQQPLVQEYHEIEDFYLRKIRAEISKDTKGNISKSLIFRKQDKMKMDYPIIEGKNGEQRVTREEVVDKTWDELSNSGKIKVLENDYINLKSDLADGRVRYIKPILHQNLSDKEKKFLLNYRDEYTNEFGEKYKGASHHEMIITNEDETQSVWVMLERNQDQSESDKNYEYWAAVMLRRSAKDPDTGENMWMMARGAQLEEMWDGTGIKTGFYEASKHKKFDYTIANSNTKVGSYSDFKHLEKRPNKDIAGVNNKSSSSSKYDIWQSLSLQRDLNNKIADIIKREIMGSNQDYLEIKRMAQIKFKKDGLKNVDEFIEQLEEMGQMTTNIMKTEDGLMIGFDTFFKTAQNSFDPRIFLKDDYWADADEAIYGSKRDRDSLANDLEDSQQIINQYKEGVSTGEQLIDGDELALNMQKSSYLKEKIENLDEIINNMEEMRTLSLQGATKDNIKKMNLANYSYYTKHRQTFTNPMNRRRDSNVHRDYITNVITSIQYKKIKADLLKGFLVIENNDMKNWLLNQAKISMQDYSYKAGFLGFEYGFTETSEAHNKIAKFLGSKKKLTPQEIAKKAANHNNWVSGLVLNTMSAVTNLTQLESLLEEWGWGDTVAVKEAMEDPQIIEALKTTGVEDLITAYADFQVGDDVGGKTKWHTPISSRAMWAALKLNKLDFINKSTPLDSLLVKMLPKGDKDNFEALRRQRASFYNQMSYLKKIVTKYKNFPENSTENEIKTIKATKKEVLILKKRIKDLNSSLNSSQINRLASWMLTWQFDPKLDIFTFSGAEIFMRKRAAVLGMLQMDKFGMLVESNQGNRFMQAPSQSMARSTVYNTMFGMSREYFPKMFGGLGVVGLQFKTYTFAQWVREYNLMEKFFDSHTGGIFNIPGWLPRLLKTYGKKGLRTLNGKKIGYAELMESEDPNFDISAERFATFLGIRGTISLVTTGLLYTPYLAEIAKITRLLTGAGNFSAMNTVRGGQSIIISTILKALLLLYASNGMMGDDEEDRLYTEWYMFFLPVAINAMIQLAKGNPDKAARTYIPGSKTITDISEMND